MSIRTRQAVAKLRRLAVAYRKMPYGGALLNVSNGHIHNGMAIITSASSDKQAKRALLTAGFMPNGYGWKLAR